MRFLRRLSLSMLDHAIANFAGAIALGGQKSMILPCMNIQAFPNCAGNCFFRAICDQLYGRDGDHLQLRRDIVRHVERHPDAFAAFVEDDEPFDAYCTRMQEVRPRPTRLFFGVALRLMRRCRRASASPPAFKNDLDLGWHFG